MANEVQIFENAEFGKVRTIVVKDEPWFVASDVCESLGLSNPTVSVNRLDEDERSKFNLGRQGEVNMVNEYGLYNLILGSRKEEAKKFKRWITHDVIPSIRKTGSYTAKSDDAMQSKRLEVMERNARTRAANLLLKIAERTNIPEYKAVCNAKAAEMVAGEMILPLPAADRRTYSATEIGTMFGVSANKIGKLANMHKLKVPEYAKLFYSKSEHSVKEVETWRYYDSVVPVFEKIFGREAV
ncbi:BRO-N domain-containing protein [Selenomonas flueggei]|uniref:BRO-N domain-containing protein n=1 Tax=Selenomonas flueggei TaxID=135080 RepID=UPI0026727B9F|nr:BRO family protein [Selenomonas flueggei]